MILREETEEREEREREREVMADTELSSRQLEEQKERLVEQLNENERILKDTEKRQKKRRREIEEMNAKIKRTRNMIGVKDNVAKNLELRIQSELGESDVYEKHIINALRDLEKSDGTLVSHEEGVKFLIQEMQKLHRTEAYCNSTRYMIVDITENLKKDNSTKSQIERFCEKLQKKTARFEIHMLYR